MKITKKFEPIIVGLSASMIIGVLAFLSFETSLGFWLMFSFGSTTLIVLVFYKSEFAQPSNIFFGHLLTSVVGIIFLFFTALPTFIIIPLAVGLGVSLMILFKVTHPPAGGNPIIIIIGSVSIDYLISPIITGSIIIIVFGIVLNRLILKKKYPI